MGASPWSKGQKVKLHSLVGRPELNGRSGLVLSFDASSGRVGVKVDGEDHPMALRPANLSEQDEMRDALVGAGLTETQCDDLFALSQKLPMGLLEMAASENSDVDLPPLLKASGVRQMEVRQQAMLVLRKLAEEEEEKKAAAVEAERVAAAKAAETKATAQNALRSLSAAGGAPPPDSIVCRSCRKALPPTSFAPKQFCNMRWRSIGCDFSVRDEGGVRYNQATAAALVMQARARGVLARRGWTPSAPPQAMPQAAGSAVEAALAGGETAEPTEEELALAGAVALYDQMVTVGIAPPALAPLRKELPALAALAYERDTSGLVDALSAAGVTDPQVVQSCSLAIMELVGVLGESAPPFSK